MLAGVTPQWLRWMFGHIARRYDCTNTIISGGLDTYWRWRLARCVTATPVAAVLDVACGTGAVLRHLACHCSPTTRLIGLDFTEAMLRVGQRRLARRRRTRPVQLCGGDAMALPYVDASFDAVTMVFGVRNFAKPAMGLAECYRVLRPGGKLCMVEFSWPQRLLIRLLYAGYFRYILPLIAWPLSGERTAYRYLRDSVLAFRQQPQLDALLRQVGFTDVQCLPLSGGITVLYVGHKPVEIF